MDSSALLPASPTTPRRDDCGVRDECEGVWLQPVLPEYRPLLLAVTAAAAESLAVDPRDPVPRGLHAALGAPCSSLTDVTYLFTDPCEPVFQALPKRCAALRVTVAALGTFEVTPTASRPVTYGDLLRGFLELRHGRIQDVGLRAGRSLNKLDDVWVHVHHGSKLDHVTLTLTTACTAGDT